MKTLALLSLSAFLLLAGCGTLSADIEPTLIPAGSAQATATGSSQTTKPTQPALPTDAVQQPTQPAPTELPAVATDPVVEALPSPTPSTRLVDIYLIAIGDNGVSGEMIGCGDSAVPVQVEIPSTQGILKATMQKLLSIKDREYGQSGLYNVFYQSDLQVDSVNIKDGQGIIALTGTMMLGGVCDNPRVEAALTKTALQFSTVSDVAITINGKPLKDVLSLK